MRQGPIAALLEFDALLPRVAAFYAAQIPPMQGHPAAELADRLAQRFAQLFQAEFVVAWCAPGTSDRKQIQMSGLSVEISPGSLHISISLAARLMFEFILRWGYSLLTLALAFRPVTGRRPMTLVHGVGEGDVFRDGSDAEFAAFCDGGAIDPLREAQALIVQLAQPRASSGRRIVYARSPLHALCRGAGLGLGDALKLAWRHVAAFVKLLRLASTSPAGLLLARDFADEATASVLNEVGLIEAVVLTNSNYSSQPLWMRARPGRRFQAHMVWYSQNIRPLLRKTDPELQANPVNRMIRSDVMWVWTRAFAEYLSSIGIRAQMHWVGPILWRLPVFGSPAADAPPLVAVFDVSPVTEAEAVNLGLLDNYYSMETARKFLQDIVEAVARAAPPHGPRARIALKHKREGGTNRDLGYFRFVDELAAKHENFTVLPTWTSLYELISGCDLTIAIPYSSPVYVASHLGRESLYYDPTNALRPTFEAAPGLEFASDSSALQAAIVRVIGRSPG